MEVSWWPSIVPDSHHLLVLITKSRNRPPTFIYIECNDDADDDDDYNGKKWDVKMKTRTINLNLSAFVHRRILYIYSSPSYLEFILFHS